MPQATSISPPPLERKSKITARVFFSSSPCQISLNVSKSPWEPIASTRIYSTPSAAVCDETYSCWICFRTRSKSNRCPSRSTVRRKVVPASPRDFSEIWVAVICVTSSPSSATIRSPIFTPAVYAEPERLTLVIIIPSGVCCILMPMPLYPTSVENPCSYSLPDKYIECVSSVAK